MVREDMEPNEARGTEMDTRELDLNLGWLIYDVARLMHRAFDRRVAGLGLTRSQWRVLATLIRGDGQTQTELAEELEIEKAPLGRLLDKLEENAWVERRPDPSDRRAKRIYRTAKIDPVLEAMLDSAEELYDDMLAGISEAELKTLLRILRIAKTNLGSTAATPGAKTKQAAKDFATP
jgi:DNA-binding MarR family transcriptional regulator